MEETGLGVAIDRGPQQSGDSLKEQLARRAHPRNGPQIQADHRRRVWLQVQWWLSSATVLTNGGGTENRNWHGESIVFHGFKGEHLYLWDRSVAKSEKYKYPPPS